MAPTPRPTLLGALRFGGESAGLTDEDAFLHDRVAFFALVSALVSLGFFVFGNLIGLVTVEDYGLAELVASWGNRFHGVAIAIGLGTWVLLRRTRPRPTLLVAVDAALTAALLMAYGAMVLVEFLRSPERVDMTMLLVTMVVLTLRAVLIPSTALQTFAVSTIGVLPAILVAWAVARSTTRVWIFTSHVNAVLWSATILVVATLTSRVIYGLRQHAQAARRLGQYLLEEKIGEGGMGTVYRARHALLRRPTAIKLLPLERVGALAIARFEREVQHTSSLTHPNTVSIYDYGRTPDGVFYYAMEFLDGVDLQRLVERTGAQDPRRVAHVMAQVAGALAEAHDRGLVHRDVKPANIVLCERGGVKDTVKVFDFGLVKDVGNADAAATAAATILGTPLYMAPEAIVAPASVGPSADLYALGAVAYYLLAGEPPFDGRTVVEVCSQHVHARPAPPSDKLGRPIPAGIEQLVMTCLAKEPERRPASARDLRARLARLDLAPWTEQDADAFFLQHPIARRSEGSTGSTTVVDVDLTARATAG
ncbi:MAG: serine/threonine protein kinase [Polyangiaceae bacterium]|nr:serine/threonine protein kinase [Polyangiaceae bacterium]